jgi:hypothetical protein
MPDRLEFCVESEGVGLGAGFLLGCLTDAEAMEWAVSRGYKLEIINPA